MLWYLSGTHSTRWEPNENYAREVMELFSLGVRHVVTGAAPYTEDDIAEIARSLTGWRAAWPEYVVEFDASRWDPGAKTFLGADRGAAGVAEVIDALTEQDAWRFYVPHRLYVELVGTEPSVATLHSLADVWGSNGDVLGVVRAVAQSPEFVAGAAIRSRVKHPVELVASAARVMGHDDVGPLDVSWRLNQLGMHPLWCPSVKGWPVGSRHLHASYLQIWSQIARRMVWDWRTEPEEHSQTTVLLFENGPSESDGPIGYARRLVGLEDLSGATQASLETYMASRNWSTWTAAGMLNLLLISPEFIVN